MEKLQKLAEIRNKRVEVAELEKQMSKPLLTDLKKIYTLLDWYNEIVEEYIDPLYPRNTQYRQYFIFTVLMLYAPTSLLGDKMPKGLRAAIAKVLCVKTESQISGHSRNIIFFYKNLQKFRQCASSVYDKVSQRVILECLE